LEEKRFRVISSRRGGPVAAAPEGLNWGKKGGGREELLSIAGLVEKLSPRGRLGRKKRAGLPSDFSGRKENEEGEEGVDQVNGGQKRVDYDRLGAVARAEGRKVGRQRGRSEAAAVEEKSSRDRCAGGGLKPGEKRKRKGAALAVKGGLPGRGPPK